MVLRHKTFKKVSFLPTNHQLKYYDDKLILGKSDNLSEEFEVILFARRDIKAVTIPLNIKTIASYAFDCSTIEKVFIPPHLTKIGISSFCMCQKLRQVEISPDSQLQIIEKNAFMYSGIESLTLPSSVSVFKDGWCKENITE